MGEAKAIEVGDYDLRGPDFETALIGAVSGLAIDADRLVRTEFRNGFPNWALYRAALAGDAIHVPVLRQWVVAFSVAYCATGGVKRQAYSDELACVAGWDALSMLLYLRELQPYTVTAQALGVDAKTYKRLRRNLYARLRVSLDEYWVQLCAAARHVFLYEKNERKSRSPDRMVSYGE